MATELRFSKDTALEAWLKGKPDDWAQVIAWRAAMRAAPLTAALVRLDMADAAKQRLQLSLYRCLLISSAAAPLWRDMAPPETKKRTLPMGH